MSDKLKSLVDGIGDKKKEIVNSDYTVANHIILGVDVTETGKPHAILKSIKSDAPYEVLGMLDKLQDMLTTLRTDVLNDINNTKPKSKRQIDDDKPSLGIISSGKKIDKDIVKIMMKHEEELIKALMIKDEDALFKLKKTIIKDILEIKGEDFNISDIKFGMPEDFMNDLKKIKDNKKGDFDIDNPKDYS